jgi:hypothetical protein
MSAEIEKSKKFSNIKGLFLFLLTLGFFTWGLGVGAYKWPPFETISQVKTLIGGVFEKKESSSIRKLNKIAFTDVANEGNFYYQPINDIHDIRKANEAIFMRREEFETAYENIQIQRAEQLSRPINSPPVIRVRFTYQNREYDAFAYGKIPQSPSKQDVASLIIPGSGLNQSYSIVARCKNNYQNGILDALDSIKSDVFTFVKPNEDYLSWHDGHGKKVSGSVIWNWQLNRGGSYSVSYLVMSIAFTKWMKLLYKETILAGLSQGAMAALLNALQSQPRKAIISSGFSLLFNDIDMSGPNQLVGVPGLGELFQKEQFFNKIKNSTTKYLFSWGKSMDPIYGTEYYSKITAEVIGPLPNVSILMHDKGHAFPPTTEIIHFLSDLN